MTNFTNGIKCFLLDMDGTVYLSGKAITGAAEAVERIRKNSKALFVTNNTSRSRNDYVAKLCGMGISVTSDDIYTAGNATVDYLNLNYNGARVHVLGTANLKQEFIGGGITLCDKSPELVVIGFDTDLTYDNLSRACTFIREGVPFIATHPDFNCPIEGGYIPDVGSFLALIKASTNKEPSLVCGKPYAAIAKGIAARVGCGGKQIAMVGDRLSTDMQFAINNGFSSILVLSGEATKKDLEQSGLKVDLTLNSIADIIF